MNEEERTKMWIVQRRLSNFFIKSLSRDETTNVQIILKHVYLSIILIMDMN